MAIYPLEFYRRAEEKWRRRSKSVRAAVTGSPSKKEGDDTLVRWPMAARNRARTPVRIRCIKKTTPPETSCGTPKEAYKAPPSLTVAIRDQQLRLVPSRRPRPWTIWTTRVVRGPAGLLASPAHDADQIAHLVVVARLAENSRYCRRASAGSWPYLPFAISSCVFLPCRTTAAARRSPLMPTGPPGAIRSRRVWRGLPGSSTQTFGVRLRTSPSPG